MRTHPMKPLLAAILLVTLVGPVLFADSEARKAKAAEKAFLEANLRKEGMRVTQSGLQYEILFKSGSEQRVRGRDIIELHYHGTLTDGTVFDSSRMRGEPIEVRLWDVISGWSEGLKLMSPGDKYRFYIPSKLAYGSTESGAIPAYSTLIFEIELIALKDKKRSSRAKR